VRLQSRSLARWNQSLRQSPNSNRALLRLSLLVIQDRLRRSAAHLDLRSLFEFATPAPAVSDRKALYGSRPSGALFQFQVLPVGSESVARASLPTVTLLFSKCRHLRRFPDIPPVQFLASAKCVTPVHGKFFLLSCFPEVCEKSCAVASGFPLSARARGARAKANVRARRKSRRCAWKSSKFETRVGRGDGAKKNELAQNICASSIECSIRVAGYCTWKPPGAPSGKLIQPPPSFKL
jgi:hypothetical protein